MSSKTLPIYTGRDAPACFVKDGFHHCLSRNPSKCQSTILFVSKPFYSSIHWRPRPITETRSRQSTPWPAGTAQDTIRRSNHTSNRAERPPFGCLADHDLRLEIPAQVQLLIIAPCGRVARAAITGNRGWLGRLPPRPFNHFVQSVLAFDRSSLMVYRSNWE